MKHTLPLFLIAALLAGCATDKSDSKNNISETLPISQATLKSFGRITLAPVPERASAFTFFTHHAKYEAAEAIANGMFAGGKLTAIEESPGKKSATVVLPMPGVSPREIARVTNVLGGVIKSLPLQPLFNQRIADLALRTHQAVIPIGTKAPADTIISVKQFSHGLLRSEGSNAPVMFHSSVLVTAHRKRDSELLALVPLDYRSPAHRLSEWAADDGAMFRVELEIFRQRCAATIVHWLYDGKD